MNGDTIDRFRVALGWVLSAVALAFLGGVGTWLLGMLIN
jgi:hypothetical protein